MEEIIEIQPTTAELIAQKQSEMLRISSELQSTDYIVMKELDGEDVAKYGDYKAKRKALRTEYNALETEVEALKIQLETEVSEQPI